MVWYVETFKRRLTKVYGHPILLDFWSIGNRTPRRPILSVIILVIKQIGFPPRARPILFITQLKKKQQNSTCTPRVVFSSPCCLAISVRNRGLRVGQWSEKWFGCKKKISTNFSSPSPFLPLPRKLQETHLHVLRRREVKPNPNPMWRNHSRTIHNVSCGSGYSTRIYGED